MDETLNKIKELERELRKINSESRKIRGSDFYTSIQKKDFEKDFANKETEIKREKSSLKGEIIETTFRVLDVKEDGRNKWEIRLIKEFSNEMFDSTFFYVSYNSRINEFNEIVFKLTKGDFVIVKMEIVSYQTSVSGKLIDIQKTSNKQCFIATVCFDSFDSKEVVLFRRFRDEVLTKSSLGRVFISVYYTLSPRVSVFIGNNILLKSFFKNIILFPLYQLIRVFRLV